MLKCRGIRHQLTHHFEGIAVGGIVLDGDHGLLRVQKRGLLQSMSMHQVTLRDGVRVDPLDAAMQCNVAIIRRRLNGGRTR